MSVIYFLIFLLACGAAAATALAFPTGVWYQALKKPNWTPPGRVFPIVWTTLYILSAFAATRIALSDAPAFGLALWSLQIALNTLWTPVFFGGHRIRMGMIVIAMLWVVMLFIVPVFWSVDVLAGILMLPYLIWISIASVLNWRILQDNPDLA